jgi:hypothetical protein
LNADARLEGAFRNGGPLLVVSPDAWFKLLGRSLDTPVWSKNWPEAAAPSRRLSIIVAQKPAQSLATSDWPLALASPWPRKQQDIALPLVVPLGMEVFDTAGCADDV